MYEGQREYTDDSVRVWQTARNYYPGTQRYATSIWSGDVATNSTRENGYLGRLD